MSDRTPARRLARGGTRNCLRTSCHDEHHTYIRARSAPASAEPPADLLRETFVEGAVVSLLRRSTNALVKALCILAHENAPLLRLDPVEDDPGGLRRRRRRILEEAAGALGEGRLDVLVRHLVGI